MVAKPPLETLGGHQGLEQNRDAGGMVGEPRAGNKEWIFLSLGPGLVPTPRLARTWRMLA